MSDVLFVFTLLAGSLLPALLWLTFFLREETHRESARLLGTVFGAGALVSLPILGLQLLFQKAAGGTIYPFLTILILALIEEALKFFGAFAAAHRDPALHEPLDAMVAMVVVSLGFATVENLFIIGSQLAGLDAVSLGVATKTLALRTVGATLLHTLTSALVGYAWARGRLAAMASGVEPASFAESSPNHRPDHDFARPFLRWVLPGIVIATALHGTFNQLVLSFEGDSLLYPTLFLIVTSFFVFRDFESLKPSQK